MEKNKFYRVWYNETGDTEKPFLYRGIYLGREGNLISFNEKVLGKTDLQEAKINKTIEIIDAIEIQDIMDAIRRREDKTNNNQGDCLD